MMKLPLSPSAVVAIRCSCGLAHSPAEWKKLPLVGIQRFDGGGALELRNCPCGSTRAIDVSANTCACVSVTRDGDTIDLVVYGFVRTPDEVSDVELLSVHLDAAGEPEWTGEPLSDAEYDGACKALLEANTEKLIAAQLSVRDGEVRNLSASTMNKRFRALFAAEDALKVAGAWS